MTLKRNIWLIVGLLCLLLLPHQAVAQGPKPAYHRQPFALDSRLAGKPGAQPFQAEIRAAGAPWLRVHLAEYNLGAASYLTLTSLHDGGQQRLDAASLPQWGNTSAYFNGDAVRLELHAAPGDKDVYVRIEEITVGEPLPQDEITIESICGGLDDRVPSTEPETGRLTFVTSGGNPNGACTAWLVSNGALLTAGHCVDLDPDGFGAALPDGVLDLDANDVIEFNVPASLANGTLVFAAPSDQYPIDLGNANWNFDGEGQGLGKDWAMFRVFPNSNTGLTPFQAQNAFFRMTNDNPAIGNLIRITGYGTDASPNLTRNQTQQTHSGGYTGESSAGADFWHRYQVDTTGGNSGSPIIWESSGYTIGIHTNAGCTNPIGTSANSGTSFEHDPLETALQNFPSLNTRYVDAGHNGLPEDGTIFRPFDTLQEAVDAAGGPGYTTVSIVRGTYQQPSTVLGDDGKQLILDAPVGAVLIQ